MHFRFFICFWSYFCCLTNTSLEKKWLRFPSHFCVYGSQSELKLMVKADGHCLLHFRLSNGHSGSRFIAAETDRARCALQAIITTKKWPYSNTCSSLHLVCKCILNVNGATYISKNVFVWNGRDLHLGCSQTGSETSFLVYPTIKPNVLLKIYN